jgi:hypothetical protein
MLAGIIASSRRRFSPLDLAPEMWLDASDASTLYDAHTGGSLTTPDGEVGRWEDKSGNHIHASNSLSYQRPVRKTGILNGKDVVRFDGADDWLIHGLGTQAAYTIVSVHSRLSDQTATYRGVIAIGTGGTGTMLLEGLATNSTKWGSFAAAEVASTAVRPSGFKVKTLTEAKTPEVKLYVNNVLDSTHPVYTVGQATNHIGGLPGGQNTHMDVAELLVFGYVLSTPQMALLHNFLFAKWAITP